MKMLVKIVSTVVGIVLLCALVVGVYIAIRHLLGALAQLDVEVVPVTAIASVVALACAAIVAGGRRRNEADGTRHLRAERMAVYQTLLDALAEAPPAPDKLAALRRLLVLSGSVEVIRGCHALDRAAVAERPALLARLVERMRTDVGASSRDLTDEELLHLVHGSADAATVTTGEATRVLTSIPIELEATEK